VKENYFNADGELSSYTVSFYKEI